MWPKDNAGKEEFFLGIGLKNLPQESPLEPQIWLVTSVGSSPVFSHASNTYSLSTKGKQGPRTHQTSDKVRGPKQSRLPVLPTCESTHTDSTARRWGVRLQTPLTSTSEQTGPLIPLTREIPERHNSSERVLPCDSKQCQVLA